jgi:hypothetical protein
VQVAAGRQNELQDVESPLHLLLFEHRVAVMGLNEVVYNFIHFKQPAVPENLVNGIHVRFNTRVQMSDQGSNAYEYFDKKLNV